MKKVVMAVLAAALMAGLGTTGAFAQEKKVEFSLNAGALTFYGGEFSFSDIGLTAGPQVDIHVTKGFMISPDLMFVTDTHFSSVLGMAGVTFNYLGKGFFAGGGAVNRRGFFHHRLKRPYPRRQRGRDSLDLDRSHRGAAAVGGGNAGGDGALADGGGGGGGGNERGTPHRFRVTKV